MTMTNLGMTKEEIIYSFIIAINKGPAGGDSSGEIVCKAINEYNKLVKEGIIVEEDPNKKLQEQIRKVRENLRGETERVNVYDKSGTVIDTMTLWKDDKEDDVRAAKVPTWLNPEAIETASGAKSWEPFKPNGGK